MVSTIWGFSSASILSVDYLDALVTQAMAYYQRSYELIQAQRDQLNTTRSLYTELQTKLNSLDSLAESLAAGSASVFNNKTVTISNTGSSDTDVVTATASSSAVTGTYSISIQTLAKAHRVQSEQQLYIDQPLGLSGTFVIGGLENRAVSNKSIVANTVDDFGVGSAIASGQKELGSGTYYVEVRDNNGTWEFRLVDEDGHAISIADVNDASNFTSGWQSLDAVAGQTYDTGRGLTITFGSGSYTAGTRGNGAASVRYDAQGVIVTVETDDTLVDIASAINNGTYAEGNEVTATIVDGYLVLTAANTGTRHQLIASDITGTVLSGSGSNGLGILGDGGTGDVDPSDGFKVTLQQAVDASFTVNGISITRQSNTGLTDVISGVTLNLLAEGNDATADLTVESDTESITNAINDFLSQFNDLMSYLKAQTDTVSTASGTYTRGGLASEPTFYRLRLSLISDLISPVDGLSADDPTSLSQIGITFDADLNLVISDSAALDQALASNLQGVANLFDALMDRIASRLDPFTRTVNSLMDQLIANIDDQIEDVNDSLARMQERMQLQEASLRAQYAALFEQIYAANATQFTLGSALFGTLNRMA
ncbi:MAG TPA: flagellar filament capping protein FliD [Caldilineae bacterium]|nr:flagellar filament capping protein FliD [Caldilineae bacterium]